MSERNGMTALHPGLEAAQRRLVPDDVLARSISATPSIQSMLDRHAAERPEAIALACTSVKDGWIRANWRRFAEGSVRAASGLRRVGISTGDQVAILLDNRSAYECLTAYIAVLRVGGVVVPLNPRSTVEEITHALETADCDWLIAGAETSDRVGAASAQGSRLHGVVGIGGVPDGWHDWRSLAESPANPADEVAGTPDKVSSILFTSGTTARAKGAVHTQGSAVATGGIIATGLALGPKDVFHHAIPFFTSSGTHFTLMPMLWSGCTMVVEPVFEGPRMVERMVEEGTTVALAVPAQFIFMLESLGTRRSELARVRLWNYGGSPMPAEIIDALAEAFPRTHQIQNYGMTETGPTGTMLMPEFTRSKLGSAGQPMPLCQTQIADEAGSRLPADEIGEIWIRSPGRMREYYRNAEATAAILADGWVRTGDIGRMDAEGFLYYVDRLKDVINRGGLKVSSMEVEDALFRHPAVLEAAVVAVPHPQLGEDICAFVALRPEIDADADELRAHCAERLTAYKVPRYIRLVSSLPRNSMGKVQKAEIRRLA